MAVDVVGPGYRAAMTAAESATAADRPPFADASPAEGGTRTTRVTCSLDVDPLVEQQIAALPQTALAALADALSALELAPWNGLPLNEINPDGAVRSSRSADSG